MRLEGPSGGGIASRHHHGTTSLALARPACMPFTILTPPFMVFNCSGLDAYYVYADKHYFKNRNAYVKDLELIESQPSSLNYMPAYYYDEVDPLAEFKVDCSHGEK